MHQELKIETAKIKTKRPLILNITNLVTMNFIADGLLAIGASPLMTNAPEEIEELMPMVDILVINIGTLDEHFKNLVSKAAALANQLGKPIVLDPVGAGATEYRTSFAQRLLQEHNISIVRGNASEIMALGGYVAKAKGVDAGDSTEQALEAATLLSQKYSCVVVVTGKIDLIIHGQQVSKMAHGSRLMTQVTGMGCLLSAVIGAFQSVEEDSFKAAHNATLYYGLCGEYAARLSDMPGIFKIHFLDALSQLLGKEHRHA